MSKELGSMLNETHTKEIQLVLISKKTFSDTVTSNLAES